MVKKNLKHKLLKNHDTEHENKTKSAHKKIKLKKSLSLTWILVFVLVAALIASIMTDGFSKIIPNTNKTKDFTPPKTEITDEQKPILRMFVMSLCPYGIKVENELMPVIEQIGEYFKLELDYIVSENENGQFASLNGQREVQGNIVRLCAKEYSKGYEYMDVIFCMNKNSGSVPDNWKDCAEKAGLDTDKINACYQGSQGASLLSESAKIAAQYQATGSPTIFLNDEKFGKSGATMSSDFLRGICAELSEKPIACENIPECSSDADCVMQGKIGVCESPNTKDATCTYIDPVSVEFIIINDKNCPDCNTQATISTSLGLFPGAKIRQIDYSENEAKELMDLLEIKLLPAYIFNRSLKDAHNFDIVSSFFVDAKDYYFLNPQAVDSKYDPTLTEVPRTLDLYVMSQCPYGTMALDAMKEVLENFGDEIDFNIYYIATEKSDGEFSSLHGQPEVDENIRELCAIKHYPENYKYMDYIWCRNKDINNDNWEACAVDGIDEDTIRACFEGSEGKKILSENIKHANELGISASPTWIANKKYRFSGIDAETVRKNICKYNDFENCGDTLSSVDAPAGSC